MNNNNDQLVQSLTQIEMVNINGGRFAYDVGTAIRWVSSVFGGPGTMAAFDANQIALEALTK